MRLSAIQKGLSLLPSTPLEWGFEGCQGRLVELSGEAVLSGVIELVAEAQHAGEMVAWVSSGQQPFFPPDAARAGLALEELAVILLADGQQATRATVRLLASGGFGLVVLDTLSFVQRLRYPPALLSHWVGLTRKHHAAMIVLTDKTARQASVSSLVSLRAEFSPNSSQEVTIHVLKDKRHGPGRHWQRRFLLPHGLRGDSRFRDSRDSSPPSRLARISGGLGVGSKADRQAP